MTKVRFGLCAAVTAGVVAWGGLAQASADLAAGVGAASDLTPTAKSFVVASDTPLYRNPHYDPAEVTEVVLRRGERPQILGEANMGLYLLVGRGGKGIGYAPRSLLCPVNLCPDIKR